MNVSRRIFQSYLPIFLIPLLLVTLPITANVSLVFAQEAEEADPAEITNGERLFLETRFAQLFFKFLEAGGDVNAPIKEGDPTLNKTVNWKLEEKDFELGPFMGESSNCRRCHFVDEHLDVPGYGMRTYTDFARRSPVPPRIEDENVTAVRNSPPLVNASLPRKNFFLHFDAEFPTMVGLVRGTLSGRNYGWIPGEGATAIAHIAKIVRDDDGTGDLASEFENIPYATLLTGTDPTLPEGFVLPEEFRVDVATATDEEIFQAVAQLIAAYTEDLVFGQDEAGNFNLSPFAVFLEKNGLPRQPGKWESDISYSQRLLRKIKRLERQGQLQFVSENPNFDGDFEFHDQSFVFGEEELQGLKIFFKQKHRQLRPSDLAQGRIGNCIACHAVPNFTDFKFHNTGFAQAEYDGIHGAGAFARLDIPGFWQRLINHNDFLPATEQHPQAKEPFRAIPAAENRQLTDLGLWNIFLNFDFPEQQLQLWKMVCKETRKEQSRGRSHFRSSCLPNPLLSRTIAQFKTPGLLDLSHSAPYFHTGQADTLEGVIRGYIKAAELQRESDLRNGDQELKGIALTEQDIKPLATFLRSLNEDYS